MRSQNILTKMILYMLLYTNEIFAGVCFDVYDLYE